ncbi:RDD family protein [Pseudomonas sp. MWU13-2105]|uniref:RDD family protein n=1 Tax=Pseudomonas sp. MWU13-2105 TaxID=2935074 RepID=UPI00201032BC|nr:RDD family protein [Pseudomonas sp. MWU13-2105]
MGISDTNVPTSFYDLASPWKRLFAYMIDLFIVFLLIVVKRVLGLFFFPHDSFVGGICYWTGNALQIAAFAYFLFGDALPNGQTVGKRLMGISAVGFPVNTPCSLFQSFLRNVPKALFSVLDAVFVFFGFRRRLGDMLAMTMVINARQTSPAENVN